MIPSPVERVLEKFPDAKPQANGQYKARCPTHDDKAASLSIGSGNNGCALLRCHAGCETSAIVAAVGLTLADLKPPQVLTAAPRPREVAAYPYTNANGDLLYEAVRYEPKDFRQRRPDPNKRGAWLWNLQGVDRVLYHLADVLRAIEAGETIFLPEGEKDADNLRSWGLCATTNAGGAAKWQHSYTEALRGAKVIIVPDNDEAGRKHADIIGAALKGVAASVQVLELPGLLPKGDVSDWIKAGGTKADLLELADVAPQWKAAIAPMVALLDNDEAASASDIPPAAGKDSAGRAAYTAVQIVGLLRGLPGYVWQTAAPDTHAAHAARIALFLRGDLCFCSQLGWLRWSGKQWSIDDKENTAAVALVATLSKRVQEEAAYLLDTAGTLARAGREADAGALAKAAQDLLKHARQVEAHQFIQASLSLAADLLRVPWEAFTPKPWVLGFDNGVWDGGAFREHRQTDYMLSVSPVAYEPNADRSEWLAVLDRMTGSDADLARTLQEFAGYCVSGASHLRVIPWAYGPRGTGKSTYAELLTTLLGKEAAAMEPDDLGDKSRERMGAKIWNKRLAVCGEAGEQRLVAETLKQLSGGDTLPVRYLFKEAFDARPRHVLLMVANDPPILNAYDDALKSRVKVLPLVHDLSLPEPFTLTGGARIEAVRQIPDSPLAIAFAAWAVEGLAAVQETQSVYLAPAVRAATAQFWQDTDTLTGFWETLDIRALGDGIPKAALRKLYEDWCEREGIRRPMQPRQWTKACEAHGLEEWRKPDTDRTRCWRVRDGEAPQDNVKSSDTSDRTDAKSAKSYSKDKEHTREDFKTASEASEVSENYDDREADDEPDWTPLRLAVRAGTLPKLAPSERIALSPTMSTGDPAGAIRSAEIIIKNPASTEAQKDLAARDLDALARWYALRMEGAAAGVA